MGRPRIQRDEKVARQVESLMGLGIPLWDTARIVGMARQTMSSLYAEEIAVGHARANAAIAQSLYRMAVKGNVTACIFWLKCRAQWHEDDPVGKKAAAELAARDRAADGDWDALLDPPGAVQ